MTEEGKPPKELRYRQYRPLDVRTWREGALTTLGWILVPCFAVLSTILFYMYEMKYINISDRDLRDMYLDQRLMNAANNHNHKHFINGVTCCNPDPQVFQESSYGCTPPWLSYDYYLTYDRQTPFCPPLILIKCPGYTYTPQCWAMRAILYPLLGMNYTTGAYTDCGKAGLLLVGAQVVGWEEPFQLYATYNNTNVGQLDMGNFTVYDIDAAKVAKFVEDLKLQYASTEYVNPNVRLGRAFHLADKPVQMTGLNWTSSVGRKKTIKEWPVAIFNWPGVFKNSGRCPNTATQEIWGLTGQVEVEAPNFNYYSPSSSIMSLTFLNDQMMVNPWRLQAVGNSSTTVGQLSDSVSLQIMTSISIYVGMVNELGACFAWMIDESMWGTKVTYTEVWQGTLNDLLAMGPAFAVNQTVNVFVGDTGAPMPTALPRYGGMWYIVMCFAMGAAWALTLGPFIVFVLPLIWWNVRSNKGQPPVVYRWMKKYRGW